MPGYVKNRGKRADGSTRWQARWRPPGDPREASRIEKMFRNKREATQWMAGMDADAHKGAHYDPRRGRVQLQDVAEEWQATWQDLAPKTQVGYLAILRKHVLPTFGQTPVATITIADVQTWLNVHAQTHAPNTTRRAVDVLRGVLALATARRYIAANPAAGIRVPRRAAPRTIAIHPLTHAQLDALVAHLPEHWRLPTLLDAYTGLRAGELWGLQRQHVDLLHATLHVQQALKEVTTRAAQSTPEPQRITPSLIVGPTKTHQLRQVSIPAFLLPQLEAHLATLPNTPDAWLFTTPQGHPVRHNLFYKRVFVPAARRAFPVQAQAGSEAARQKALAQGKTPQQADKLARQASPFRFHDLRHTCAAWLIQENAHPLAIRNRLGHKDIQTTMNVYGHLFPNADAALAQALDAARTTASTQAAQQLAAPPKPPQGS